MFQYHAFLNVTIDGVEYEFNKEWQHQAQFRAGDVLHIDGLEEVSIAHVAWYFGHLESTAYLQLEHLELGGPKQQWTCLLKSFDGVNPDLED